MPELPEVETIKRQLVKELPLTVSKLEKSEFSASIVKNQNFSPVRKTISEISRVGKLLRFHIGDNYILSTLGMSGSWRVSDKKIIEKHTHFQLSCRNKSGDKRYIAYVDPRRFGNIYLFSQSEMLQYMKRLGVDVSSKNFTPKVLIQFCQQFPSKELKPFLLDQKYLSGIGNYMASEICARAGILPTRLLKDLSKINCQHIVKATKSVLNQAIKNNGTTFAGGYTDATGSKGEGVKNLVVFYQDLCGLCKKNKVIKESQKGRGTYFCPKCQS